MNNDTVGIMTDNEHWNIRYRLESIWNPSNKRYTKDDEFKGLISIIAGYEKCQKSYEQEIAELKEIVAFHGGND